MQCVEGFSINTGHHLGMSGDLLRMGRYGPLAKPLFDFHSLPLCLRRSYLDWCWGECRQGSALIPQEEGWNAQISGLHIIKF